MTFVNAPSRIPSKTRLAPALLGAACLLFAGCAYDRGVALPEISDWESRRQVLQALEVWSFSGRIAVNSGDEGFNGRLRWRQGSTDFSATVSGPFGAGAVQIEGNGRAISVTDSDGAVTLLPEPELDLQMRYGWTIPVNSLRYWALGIPDPMRPAETAFDDDGNLSTLEQGGWTVAIGRYRAAGGQTMPSRISAENAHSRVRLIIDRWTFY